MAQESQVQLKKNYGWETKEPASTQQSRPGDMEPTYVCSGNMLSGTTDKANASYNFFFFFLG